MSTFEMGGFLPLELQKKEEYYCGSNVVRLNSGRSAILYALQSAKISKIYLPAYNCDSVYKFLMQNDIEVVFYHINSDFLPELDDVEDAAAVLWINYFGLMGAERISKVVDRFPKLIIDNTQAFFSKPIDDAYNVYSCRKFVGVSDGSYLIKNNLKVINLKQCKSYSSGMYLLQSIDEGTNSAYKDYLSFEKNLEIEYKSMSKLTIKILRSIDYESVISSRRNNYTILSAYLDGSSLLNFLIDQNVPMVYPYLIEDDYLRKYLINNKVYVSTWWENKNSLYLYNEFEQWLSKYLLPLPIDQRYGEKDMLRLIEIIMENNNNGK